MSAEVKLRWRVCSTSDYTHTWPDDDVTDTATQKICLVHQGHTVTEAADAMSQAQDDVERRYQDQLAEERVAQTLIRNDDEE